MTKFELIDALHRRTGLQKLQLEQVIAAFSDIVTHELSAGGEIPLPSIGKLKVHTSPARNGRNPKTGETISLPARRKAKFSGSKTLTDVLNRV